MNQIRSMTRCGCDSPAVAMRSNTPVCARCLAIESATARRLVLHDSAGHSRSLDLELPRGALRQINRAVTRWLAARGLLFHTHT